MSLDQRARTATRELLEQLPPDADRMLSDLKRTRTHRNVARSAAALAAVALMVGTALVVTPDDKDPVRPVNPVGGLNGQIVVRNGTLLRAFDGELAVLPKPSSPYITFDFTADGSELVYGERDRSMVAFDVGTGERRTLGPCVLSFCDGSLSPDGSLLATAAKDGVRVRTVATGDTELLSTPGVSHPLTPRWSPDGSMIAFTTGDGVYVMAADASGLRLLHSYGVPDRQILAPSWAPDGHALAFFDQQPRGGTDETVNFQVMSIRPDGTDLRSIHAAGHCYCLGGTPPSLAWSPDGRWIAVVIGIGAGPGGLYLVRPDGTDWQLHQNGSFGTGLAWRPVPE